MKISLALGERKPLSRQTAWGCLMSNVAMPGAGSLASGRKVGYAQMLMSFVGIGVSGVFGIRLIFWMLSKWSAMRDPATDQLDLMAAMWRVFVWPLIGFVIFGLSWLWALGTSLAVVAEAKRTATAEPPSNPVPPKL
ncbi:MAG TPA: hypothetical protein VLT36_07190 [Candidatus Dormibacteraeota bacterium]|nr:hypothetical protein [Candidatus Dormibacteraeota bacterium]